MSLIHNHNELSQLSNGTFDFFIIMLNSFRDTRLETQSPREKVNQSIIFNRFSHNFTLPSSLFNDQ